MDIVEAEKGNVAVGLDSDGKVLIRDSKTGLDVSTGKSIEELGLDNLIIG